MFLYIADFNLPNTSAYSHHVLKISDAFKSFNRKFVLLIPFVNKKYNFKK